MKHLLIALLLVLAAPMAQACNVLQNAMQNKVDDLQADIDQGCDIHIAAADGSTPVFYTVVYNHPEALEILIRYHAELNHIGMFGHTPLTYAIAMGNRQQVFQMLIDAGADLHAKNAEGQTPLIAAVDGFEPELAKILIDQKAGLNDQDPTGKTPLFKAIDNSDKEMTKLLVENGADLEVRKSGGETALLYATSMAMGENKIALYLIEKGANVNAEDISGNTSLMNATQDEAMAVIIALLEKGADIDHRNHRGISVIMQAAEMGNEDLLLYFLDHHAQVNQRRNDGLTAVMLAERGSCDECVLTLLHAGAFPYLNQPNSLHWEIDMSVVGRMSAFVNYASPAEENHLILAMKNQYFIPAAKMIDLPGINLNQQDETGTSALMLMVKARQKNLVEAMLLHHVDRSLCDHHGMTALDYAIQLGFTEIAELLK